MANGINSTTVKKMRATYPSKNYGEIIACNSWFVLREVSFENLKGRFTLEEIRKMLAAVEDCPFSPSQAICGNPLSQKIENGGSFWNELKLLNSTEIFFLIEWLSLYWILREREKINETNEMKYIEAIL